MLEASIRYKLLGFEGNTTYKLLILKGAVIKSMNVYFKANRASIRPTYTNVGTKISNPLRIASPNLVYTLRKEG
jgi:hypothetical protein